MMDRFNDLNPREKILIIVMLSLFALIILWQFVFSPVITGHDKANKARLKAQNDLIYVQNNIGLLSASGPSGASQAFTRNTIFELARNAEIKNLSRVQPQPNGDLKIWVDNETAPTLYKMLSEIEKNYATRITAAQINRREGGKISAQISFSMPPADKN